MMRKLLFTGLLFLLMLSARAQTADIISGLDHLPCITQTQAAQFPTPSGTVELTLNAQPLPYDSASNTYFIPQSALTSTFDGQITLTQKEGYIYYLLPDALCDKAEALAYSRGYTIYGVSGDKCEMSTVLFSALPILTITTQTTSLPGEEDELCSVLYYEAQSGSLSVKPLSAEINLRGNTSKIFPKQSYRLQLIDPWGDNKHASLCNLRTDDDWILNPMYTDSTKLREPLSYALWELINSSGSAAQSSRIRYAEVFFNSSYHGLYGVQERVDIKQVEGSKKTDVLYKVRTNQRPTVEELLACTNRTACMAFEVENGDDFLGDTTSLYRPAAAYIAALNGETLDESISLSLQNAIDYGLFVMLTQAHDSHFKNQFLNAVITADNTTLYKLPWDLNYTLGDVYQKELAPNNYTDYYLGSLVMDGYFEILINTKEEHILKAVQSRWQQLRQSVLTQENLSLMASSLDSAISAACSRDHVRWPQGGRSQGNTGNYEEIVDYFAFMLPRIDNWIAALNTDD